MKIFLLRHGNSPSAHEAGVKSDSQRPLSEEGRDNARKAAAYLQLKGGAPSRILTSPLLRAQQTALEAAKILQPLTPPAVYEPLANLVGGTALMDSVRGDFSLDQEILLVGHQPQLGDAASALTGRLFDLHPAGLIAVETDGDWNAKLLWSANPAQMPN